MKKINLIVILLLAMSCNIFAVSKELIKARRHGAKVKLTFNVIDDDGMVVSNADFKVNFYDPKNVRMNGWDIIGKTDTNGIFIVKDKAYDDMTYCVEKDGYYTSRGRRIFSKVQNGKWQPWNPTIEIVLREIRNPIPMYAKRVETYIPATNIPCGYDLMIGDWVKPYGKGKQKDINFNITQKSVKSRMDFEGELEITFSKEKDGFCKYEKKSVGKSVYDWDYTAPTNGYTYPLYITVGYKLPKGYYKKSDVAKGYFRIRSITNHYGEIVSAYYGKCTDKIDFDVRGTKTGFLRFQYYLNPTPNDRNMEFDPKHNLLKVLSREEVREP